MTTHLAWETLNELAGLAPGADAAAAPAIPTVPDHATTGDGWEAARLHLAACAPCREALESLRAIDAAARALPPAISPPDELWRAVSASIAQRPPARRAPVRAPTAIIPPPRWRVQVEARWLAAAALVLMTLTATGTAWWMRRGAAPVVASGGVAGAVAIPAGFAATERAYLDDVAQLQALLEAQRSRLAPATLAVVERALATIDTAIAEARAALIADPVNQELAELLAASYRQKVELLRRAAEVTPST